MEPEEQQGNCVSQQVCLLSHGCIQVSAVGNFLLSMSLHTNVTANATKAQRVVVPCGETSMLTCSGSQGRFILLVWTEDDI